MGAESLKNSSFEAALEQVAGIKRNDQIALSDLKESFGKALNIGITRQDKNQAGIDGGLLAIDTGIDPLRMEDLNHLKPDTMSLCCAFGGTNWEIGTLAVTDKGRVEYTHLETLDMERATKNEEGQLIDYSPTTITALMGQAILTVLGDQKIDIGEIDALAIAFGFAQDNELVDYGVEARLNSESSSKSWQFVLPEGEQSGIGFEVKQFLVKDTRDQWRAEVVAVGNDTNQTANDLSAVLNEVLDFATGKVEMLSQNLLEGLQLEKDQVLAIKSDLKQQADQGDWQQMIELLLKAAEAEVLSMGVVAGTGDNICLQRFNLESGKWPINSDPVFEKLHQLGKLPTDYDIIEYKMGGQYLIDRLAAAVLLMGDQGWLGEAYQDVADKIFEGRDEFLSLVAEGGLEFDELDLEDNRRLEVMAQMILNEAADLIAIKTIAVAEASGYDIVSSKRGLILGEGGVLWKGYGIKERIKEVFELLGYNLGFVQARGLVGAGIQALVKYGEWCRNTPEIG